MKQNYFNVFVVVVVLFCCIAIFVDLVVVVVAGICCCGVVVYGLATVFLLYLVVHSFLGYIYKMGLVYIELLLH